MTPNLTHFLYFFPTKEIILNVEVPFLQAKRKIKIPREKTIDEFVEQALRKIPIENVNKLGVFIAKTGIWLEEKVEYWNYRDLL
jgi:hypothetical protein